MGINHLADRTDEEMAALRGFRSSKIYNGKWHGLLSQQL
jgi:hypothetical protein